MSAQAILAQRAFAVRLAYKDFVRAGALLDKVEALFNRPPIEAQKQGELTLGMTIV